MKYTVLGELHCDSSLCSKKVKARFLFDNALPPKILYVYAPDWLRIKLINIANSFYYCKKCHKNNLKSKFYFNCFNEPWDRLSKVKALKVKK